MRKIKVKPMNPLNIYKRLSLHHTLRLIIVLVIIIAVIVRLFIPVHGHRTWWAAIFHHDHPITTAKAMTPVPETDDNNARQVLLAFYKNYSAARDNATKKKLVSDFSTSTFLAKYINSPDLDLVTCTINQVSSVQIVSERTHSDGFGYIISEDLPGGGLAEPQVSLQKQGTTYKISEVGCSPS